MRRRPRLPAWIRHSMCSMRGFRRTKADTLARARELIELATPVQQPRPPTNQDHAPAGAEAIDKPIHPCPCCGSPMVVIEMFQAGSTPRNRPTASTTAVRIEFALTA